MSRERGVPPGRLLARGRDADVYALDDDRVLRRSRGPAGSAEGEAQVMRHAAAHGVIVPEVLDVEGGDLVLRRIHGPTMLEDLGRRPWRLSGHAGMLADLHEHLRRVPAPAGLPRPLGRGRGLLHLDLHPGNVLLSADGPVLIDWSNAAAGPPGADLAMTWTILATSVVPGATPARHLLGAGRRLFLRRLLDRGDRDAALGVLPEVAELRRRDPNLLESERAAIDALLGRLRREV